MPVPLYHAKAEFFRSLAHPARIRVLELLADSDLPVHALLSRIEIEPSNLSQQLSVLRQAGLVTQRREGGEVIYSLALPEVRDLLLAARQILRTKLATGSQLVDEITRPPARKP
ncbi:MAG: metalloregulator ArsR/SmtB family transcription factor [Marmoricola sp.]